MRKLAMLTTAMLGLAFASPSFAQGVGANMPNQAGPQPGLPAGVGGGTNAQAPAATGNVTTTPVGRQPMMAAPAPMATPADVTPAPVHHYRRRHRVVHHRRMTHTAPATPASATPQ